ncbi:hypothetical protein QE152_g13181 [Popillia japonica]|uniref:Uncharacterized protein n=1 Tax=Popillia japonica TaxID=7064 RepID=A0AAW1LAU8_POPJA
MELRQLPHILTLIILTSIVHARSATVKDIFNLTPDGSLRVPRDNKFYIDATVKDIFNLTPDGSLRVPRDNKFYIDRQDNQRDISSTRLLKPEESPEARDSQPNTAIEKRCSRCDTYSTDYRYPSGGSGGGGGANSYYRSDYRYQDPRYDQRRYYDDRYDSYDRYDPYDSYYDSYSDRDRYRRPSTGYGGRDEYDRYEPRDRYYTGGGRDRYYDRQYDRGVGYDNIGYDYRGYDNRNGYRPHDETYRGTSGFDSTGRGYYYNRGIPESGGKWGTYASSWGYGRDDRDKGYRDYGSQYRPRDSFNYGTSYLYARPSSSSTTTTNPTTTNPSNTQDSDNSVTDTPNDTPATDPIFFNIMSLPLKIIDKKSF